MDGRWEFWIDRGGTFTDVVARRPDGTLAVHKLLSREPGPVRRSRRRRASGSLLGGPGRAAHSGRAHIGGPPRHHGGDQRPAGAQGRARRSWSSPRASATRCGSPTRTGREIFERQIIRPRDAVLAGDRGGRAGRRATARSSCRSTRTRPPATWRPPTATGFRSVAVVCMHGYRYPAHEARIGEIARQVGFTQVSLSHATSPLMKLVSRGDTTLVDAYLSPILGRYVDRGRQRTARRPAAVHAVQRRADRRAPVPRQGRDPVRAGRRHRRHGPHRAGRGLRPGDRVRHGRHLDRRVALRRGVRAAVRDPGRRGADAGADAEHPHRRRGRRVGAALRRQPVPGRPGLGRG